MASQQIANLPNGNVVCVRFTVAPPIKGRYTVSGSGVDCKSTGNASGGSTPTLPTI